MESLSKNWITENHIDFEYKKYVLLAYLQHVSENFTEQRLYPFLSDLVDHYRNLKVLRENKKNLFESFPGRARTVDLEQLKIIYEKLAEDDCLIKEIESIIDYSIPQMEFYLKEGKKIYDFIEDHLKIFSVGIVPLNNESGYLFLRQGDLADTRVYEYHVSIFENPVERYRGIHVQYMMSYEKTLLNTFESIKSDLLLYNKSLPNPATYVIETGMIIPFEETFLPMAKRALVKRVAGIA
ncbi:MAG: hypothetical protein NT126_02790 [Bacteroidetes bacterium]|nr:hypothetical protein [Bacteroidota bacterium]